MGAGMAKSVPPSVVAVHPVQGNADHWMNLQRWASRIARVSAMTQIEKRRFEKLFGMGSGYCSNFSDRTFREFWLDTIGIDPYQEKYNYGSGSKANRMRGFWNAEPNHLIARLLRPMVALHLEQAKERNEVVDASLVEECERILVRLEQASAVANADALAPSGADEDFDHVAREVQNAINSNRPEAGLDRLHTFVTKFARALCVKHGLPADRDLPLHNLFGSYIKYLRTNGHLGSRMGEQILKSSIGILDAFNDVRNNKSMAHDNEILGYDESLLIFSNIATAVRFVRSLEQRLDAKAQAAPPAASSPFDDDIPF
jgi:hypothetical protein